MMIKEIQRLRQKRAIADDMLKGNICRLFISKDLDECERMADFAIKRIDEIKDLSISILKLKEETQ